MMSDTVSNQQGEADVARIKERISALVAARAANGDSIYYLSQLGNDLGKKDVGAIVRWAVT
jgi:hypothetical protein